MGSLPDIPPYRASVLLHLFGAGRVVLQIGQFIESIATRVAVMFAMRTRREFVRSNLHRLPLAAALGSVTVGESDFV